MPFNWSQGRFKNTQDHASINDDLFYKNSFISNRKVASVSGDCRRALDICRRATEIAEESAGTADATVIFVHVQQALEEMFASPKIRAIRNCSRMEKLFLQAVAAEVTRTGIEEVAFSNVYIQLETLAALNGISKPPIISELWTAIV